MRIYCNLVYICVHMYIHACSCACVHVWVTAWMCDRTSIHVCMTARMHASMPPPMHNGLLYNKCVCICVIASMHVCGS